MKKEGKEALQMRIEIMLPKLNEYQRRMFLSSEAKSIGYGGISHVSRLSGVSRQTLTERVKELDNPDAEIKGNGKCRKTGGGRKTVWEHHPEIFDKLKEMVDAHTQGDPMSLLLHTNKSQRTLAKALTGTGYKVSKETVRTMLKMLGYSLQADKKTLTQKPTHVDRDAQFEHINTETKKAVEEGNPVTWLSTSFQ